MPKISYGECESCGKVEQLKAGSLGSLPPDEWWSIHGPGVTVYSNTWFCSADCLARWAVNHAVGEALGHRQHEYVPMSVPRSPVVHALPLGSFRDHSDGMTPSACGLVRLGQVEVAAGDGLRACKRCAATVEYFEPGTAWFRVSDATAEA